MPRKQSRLLVAVPLPHGAPGNRKSASTLSRLMLLGTSGSQIDREFRFHRRTRILARSTHPLVCAACKSRMAGGSRGWKVMPVELARRECRFGRDVEGTCQTRSRKRDASHFRSPSPKTARLLVTEHLDESRRIDDVGEHERPDGRLPGSARSRETRGEPTHCALGPDALEGRPCSRQLKLGGIRVAQIAVSAGQELARLRRLVRNVDLRPHAHPPSKISDRVLGPRLQQRDAPASDHRRGAHRSRIKRLRELFELRETRRHSRWRRRSSATCDPTRCQSSAPAPAPRQPLAAEAAREARTAATRDDRNRAHLPASNTTPRGGKYRLGFAGWAALRCRAVAGFLTPV